MSPQLEKSASTQRIGGIFKSKFAQAGFSRADLGSCVGLRTSHFGTWKATLRDCLDELLALQPTGPYHSRVVIWGNDCSSHARELETRHAVDLVALLDNYPLEIISDAAVQKNVHLSRYWMEAVGLRISDHNEMLDPRSFTAVSRILRGQYKSFDHYPGVEWNAAGLWSRSARVIRLATRDLERAAVGSW